MKRIQRALCAVLILLLIAVSNLYAQNSNIGTEFWTGFMDHITAPSGGTKMSLYVASDVSSTVTVTITDGSFAPITANVVANVITIIDIPAAAFLGNIQSVTSKGIHIVSTAPIAVYAHIYLGSVSGATLVLPVNTLATEYYSINYKQISNNNPAYSTFMIIATEDSTKVDITPTAKLLNGEAANTKFSVVLQKGQIYQGLSLTDLTGTMIKSVNTGSGCKRIAVYSGSSKISIGRSPTITNNAGSADNLIQQVYPTASWGKNFITVPLKSRDYDIFRVVVSDPTAVVTLNGTKLTGLVNNFYYEFYNEQVNVISSDKPIQVAQYSITQSEKADGTHNKTGDVGDPEMIYLNPIEQNIDHVTLYSTAKAAINPLLNFINVVIPTPAASSFILDGVNQASKFTAIGNGYSTAQLNVGVGATHNISASQGFNATAYGFGNAESYGYAAGTNVKNLNEYVQYVDPTTNQVQPSSCTGVTLTPQIVLPYQTARIIWNFGDNVIDTVYNAVPAVIVKDDTTNLYKYSYKKAITYSKSGSYNVKITSLDPQLNECGSNDEIYLNFTIVDPPPAKFSIVKDSVCLNDVVQFTDQSDGSNNPIKTWKWKFGDGDTSVIASPSHAYKVAGNYVISLTVAGATGCATTFLDTIHVRALPVVAFVPTPLQPICEKPLTVTFTDKSTTTEGKIVAWLWDFGDNLTDTTKSPVHTFASAQAQPYKVSLTVVTDKGCSNILVKDVTVNYTPKASFNLPDVCEYDLVTRFTAISSIPDSTIDALTYTWNFGDPGANNTATGKTVGHHFKGIGKYDVKLTVTSAYGCVKDTTQTIQVNGGNPKAAFKIIGGNKICSNNPVIFRNDAYVEGGFENGKITSFKFDFGDGTPVQTLRVDSGQVFTYTYPKEYLTEKVYITSMIAYSGETCFSVKVYDTIYVEPIPKTKFDVPAKICQNASPLQLRDYALPTYTAAPAGKPVFDIDNIRSPDGVLNPIILGTGKHSLTCYYIFNATGCADTTRDTITIEPIASVKAGKDVTILLGQPAQLKPTVIGGSTNTFLWWPSAGLSDPTSEYPKASPLVNTTYRLTVTSTTDSLACSVSDSLTITVLQPPTVPNTFTPNGDSNNDTWYIKDLNTYPGCTVEVYTRDGGRVFYSVGYATPWDGRYNGVNLPVGTYYYVIDPKNGRSKIAGYVTIIR
ncbi:MAG: PKD domain-containing protein [Mucilaginibacter sp.]|uniref:PKD domain-containing protein n=1 Tax=Mucilaginibacter sp. TaxID=1882438 RepID=UPI00326300BA